MAGAVQGILVAAVLALGCLLLRMTYVHRRSSANLEQLQAELDTAKQTEHVRAAQWKATIASMPDGLMVLDRDLRLIEWNQRVSELCGAPPDTLRVGMSLEDILRAQAKAGEFGDVDPDQEAKRRLALIQAGISTGTIERQRPNGEILELRRSPMAGGGFVTLYTDVTQRRRAEEQLRQAQKMEAIGHLTAGVAHDFNNLLTVISGNLDIAATALEAANPLRARDKIQLARHGAERAATLTQRLVAFSRRQHLEPQPLNANRVVSAMTELVRHSLGAIELETVLAGELWDAIIDPNQLENALLNLAVNARDAMPEGGKITIETANAHLDAAYAAANDEVEPGQYVMIAVSDGGTGMSPAQVARAFEPFFTTKEIGKGSGLGLSQVLGFIKQSNGHVKIYSELGSGTTVKLYLPRYVADVGLDFAATEQPIAAAVPSELPRARPDETIIAVEDDEDVLAYSTEALEWLGYRVFATSDPSHALSLLDTHPETVLLFTDMALPGLSGRELVKEVFRRRPALAVLFTTGYPSNAILHHELLDRAVRVISKPFAVAELAAAVRVAIDDAAGSART